MSDDPGYKHWRDATGKWWHEFYQGGKGHPADPAHAFQHVDVPCDCETPPTRDDRGAFTDAR